jgi:quercetin dioxygenase-like cupin family protein
MRRALPLLLSILAFAETAEVEITAEPHHHLVFTNDQVRVFSVEVPPHSETLMHRHRHDYIYVTLGAAEVVNAVAGKDPVTVKLADGETRFTPGNFAHIARDLTERPFRNVTIELLQDDKLRQSQARDSIRGPIPIQNGGRADILWVNDSVRAIKVELAPGFVFEISNQAQLLVAVSDIDLPASALPSNNTGPVASPLHLKSGEFVWIPAGHAQQLRNLGPAAAKFVTLEFP